MGWTSKPKTPGPTAEEIALSRDRATDFNDYQTRFVDAENAYVARNRASPGDISLAGGEASADVQQAATGGDMTAVQRGMGAGILPGSGRSIMARAGIAAARGEGSGEAVARRVQSRKNQELAALLKMAAFGRNLSDTNRVATSQAAQQGTQTAIDSMASKLKRQEMWGEAIGTGIGMYGSSKNWLSKEGKA